MTGRSCRSGCCRGCSEWRVAGVQMIDYAQLLPVVVEASPLEQATIGPVVHAAGAVGPRPAARRGLRGSGRAGAPAAAAVALLRLRFSLPLPVEVVVDFTNVTAWCGPSWAAAEKVAHAALEYAHAEEPADVRRPHIPPECATLVLAGSTMHACAPNICHAQFSQTPPPPAPLLVRRSFSAGGVATSTLSNQYPPMSAKRHARCSGRYSRPRKPMDACMRWGSGSATARLSGWRWPDAMRRRAHGSPYPVVVRMRCGRWRFTARSTHVRPPCRSQETLTSCGRPRR